MDPLKKFILALLFLAFWLIAAADLGQVIQGTYPVFEDMYGKTPEEKKKALGSLDWVIAQKIAGIIPEDARIIVLTNDPTGMLFCAYELYPRKMFAIIDLEFNPTDQISIDMEWLARKKIDWAIVPRPGRFYQVFIIIDGKPISVTDFRA
jgi:hypothetical protein